MKIKTLALSLLLAGCSNTGSNNENVDYRDLLGEETVRRFCTERSQLNRPIVEEYILGQMENVRTTNDAGLLEQLISVSQALEQTFSPEIRTRIQGLNAELYRLSDPENMGQAIMPLGGEPLSMEGAEIETLLNSLVSETEDRVLLLLDQQGYSLRENQYNGISYNQEGIGFEFNYEDNKRRKLQVYIGLAYRRGLVLINVAVNKDLPGLTSNNEQIIGSSLWIENPSLILAHEQPIGRLVNPVVNLYVSYSTQYYGGALRIPLDNEGELHVILNQLTEELFGFNGLYGDQVCRPSRDNQE